MIILILAATIMTAMFIPAAMRHDRLLEEPEDVDYDLLDAERDTRLSDDADAARKEYGF
ncbi:hypothetical protein [Arthrobacter sp. MA-N2]|uniref:hypothetical protein n=1 Tax=Arthrobacter sp. MA-N2 TaxID=1101188 RepID=UPI0004B7D51F|nr:hypothetical protein [Arthrobacter sp. MA-N2]